MVTETEKLSKEAIAAINTAIPDRLILISAISLWEITMLNCNKRLQFSTPIRMWIEKALTAPGVALAPLNKETLIESCLLSGEIHADPADQMIVATARIENAILITRDQKIIQYAENESLAYIRG